MKWKSGFILRRIAGDTVLVPVGQTAHQIPGLLGLSESGALLYEKLQSECTREELIRTLLGEYEVSYEEAARDVDAFVDRMDRLGVLER